MLSVVYLLAVLSGAHTETKAAFAPHDVLVRLGDATLTFADVDAFAAKIPLEVRSGYFDDPKRIGTLLQTMVLRRAIVGAALSQLSPDIDVNPIREHARRKLLTEIALQRQVAALPEPPLEARARAYYDEHPEEFEIGESISVTHVLISTKDRKDSEALELANEVYASAVNGRDFSELVEQYSDDPSRHGNNGRISNFGRRQMALPFEEAAFAMTVPGELSAPVKTQFGYHVIRFENRVPKRTKPYEQVRDIITESLSVSIKREQEAEILSAYSEQGLYDLALEMKLDQEPEFVNRLQLAFEEQYLLAYRSKYVRDRLEGPALEIYAKEFYRTNLDRFRIPTEVWVDQIILSREGDAGDSGQKKADDIAKSVRSSPDRFREIADMSSDTRQVNRKFSAASDNDDIAKRALNMMEVGEILGPLETAGAYHIFKLTQRTEAHVQTFEDVREQLLTGLRKKHAKRLWEAHLFEFEQLPSDAVADAIYSLRDRYLE